MIKLIFTVLVLNLFFALSAQEVFYTKPYLQIGYNAAPDALTLVWHTTDFNANWTVEYSNNKVDWKKSNDIQSNTVSIVGTTSHKVIKSTMEGLTQGGIFTYRVLKNNIIVFTAEGHAPKSSKQAYQFVVFGDIGAETKDQKQLALRAYLEKPDFVVVPGDIVYEAGLISEYRKKFWPVYNADTANANGAPIMRSVPFLAAVGNHDADSRDLDKTPDALAYYMYWVQPLNGPLGAEGGAIVPILKGSEINKNAFTNAAGKAYPRMTNFSYNYGNAHWTFLDADTYVDWTNKELTDWVSNDLASSKDAIWHFVVFHHPGFNSSVEHFEQQQMRLLAPVFEKGKVDVVFNGHVHNYQRSFPMTFAPVKQGVLLMGGKDGKTIRGRVVTGKWTLDKQFDGKKITKPNGVIYIVTGAGGQELYNPEQEKDADSWQHFTCKFISTVHSLTIAKVSGNKLVIQQKSQDGKIVDALTITK
jgi:predicted phosphodiesterase